jgi:hypothetical protein
LARTTKNTVNPPDSFLHDNYIKFTHKSASVKKMNIPNLLMAPEFNRLKAFLFALEHIDVFL